MKENEENIISFPVFIASKSGKKFHIISNCSGLKTSIEINEYEYPSILKIFPNIEGACSICCKNLNKEYLYQKNQPQKNYFSKTNQTKFRKKPVCFIDSFAGDYEGIDISQSYENMGNSDTIKQESLEKNKEDEKIENKNKDFNNNIINNNNDIEESTDNLDNKNENESDMKIIEKNNEQNNEIKSDKNITIDKNYNNIEILDGKSKNRNTICFNIDKRIGNNKKKEKQNIIIQNNEINNYSYSISLDSSQKIEDEKEIEEKIINNVSKINKNVELDSDLNEIAIIKETYKNGKNVNFYSFEFLEGCYKFKFKINPLEENTPPLQIEIGYKICYNQNIKDSNKNYQTFDYISYTKGFNIGHETGIIYVLLNLKKGKLFVVEENVLKLKEKNDSLTNENFEILYKKNFPKFALNEVVGVKPIFKYVDAKNFEIIINGEKKKNERKRHNEI